MFWCFPNISAAFTFSKKSTMIIHIFEDLCLFEGGQMKKWTLHPHQFRTEEITIEFEPRRQRGLREQELLSAAPRPSGHSNLWESQAAFGIPALQYRRGPRVNSSRYQEPERLLFNHYFHILAFAAEYCRFFGSPHALLSFSFTAIAFSTDLNW